MSDAPFGTLAFVKPVLQAAREADEFFMKRSPVHEALERIARALSALEIPFVVVGALAANAHGHVRTTADVDILLTREGLEAFKARWLGRGWVERFAGSKGMKDSVTGVQIDVLLTGEYPGDGKVKPVVFPNPSDVVVRDADGVPVVALDTLIELKLASGMTAAHRPRDLDDVIQLIRVNDLPRSYAEELDPYVRERFDALWEAAQYSEE